jgi:hypothetical protein
MEAVGEGEEGASLGEDVGGGTAAREGEEGVVPRVTNPAACARFWATGAHTVVEKGPRAERDGGMR